MTYHLMRMVFGSSPAGILRGENVPGALVAVIIPAVLIILLGIYVPPALTDAFRQVSRTLAG